MMKTSKTLIFVFFASLVYCQGVYLTNESGIIIETNYGKVSSAYQGGFLTSVSIYGIFDAAYSYSKYFDEDKTENSIREYIGRAYLLNKETIFISTAIGYMDMTAEGKIFGFPIKTDLTGYFIEGGFHLTEKDIYKKGTLSIYYRYSEPLSEAYILNVRISNRELMRKLIIEGSIIFKFSNIGLIFGPRAVLEFDATEASLFGLKLGVFLNN